MRPIAACLVGLALLGAVPDASAAETGGESYYYTEYEERWYGWQNIVVDVPLLTMFYVAQSSGESGLAVGAFVGFVAGSPMVHLANGRSTPAVLSGFAHLLLPVGTWTIIPPIMSRATPDVSQEQRTAIAVTVGGLLATAFDAIWISWDETEHQVEYEAEGGSIVPQVGWTGRAGWIGVGGCF